MVLVCCIWCCLKYCCESEPKPPVQNPQRSVVIVPVQVQRPEQTRVVHMVRQEYTGKLVYLNNILNLFDLILFIYLVAYAEY